MWLQPTVLKRSVDGQNQDPTYKLPLSRQQKARSEWIHGRLHTVRLALLASGIQNKFAYENDAQTVTPSKVTAKSLQPAKMSKIWLQTKIQGISRLLRVCNCRRYFIKRDDK